MRAIEPFKGPTVTWNKADVQRYVDRFGVNRAVKEIAGKWFTKEYVRESIQQLMADDAGHLKTITLSSKGTL